MSLRFTMALRSCRADLLGLILLAACIAGCDPGPQTASDFQLLALKEYSAKNFSLALQHCDKAIELGPENYHGYSIRSMVNAALGNSRESEADWQKAFDLAPDEDVRLSLMKSRKKKEEQQSGATQDENP